MVDHIVNGRQYQDINSVSEPKNYALTGKIMLSAIIILFAVVVIMVCLHIYARWYILRARRRHIRRARRRTHLVFYIEPDNNPTTIVPIPTHGLDPAVLKSLPTFTFSTAEEQVLECAVCLSEFEEGEKGRMLPKCNHCFHVECIDMWFHSHSTCPLCRSPVDTGDVQVVSDYGDAVGDEVVVELTQNQLDRGPESSRSHGEEGSVGVGPSSSFGGRRKGVDMVGVSIEVPPRRSQSFCFGVDESGPSRSPGFKSPTGRILSLKRIWSREKKSPLPSPSGAGAGSIGCELDIESG